jgi:ABC-type branched-subunit amino acid transport system permease subunit
MMRLLPAAIMTMALLNSFTSARTGRLLEASRGRRRLNRVSGFSVGV